MEPESDKDINQTQNPKEEGTQAYPEVRTENPAIESLVNRKTAQSETPTPSDKKKISPKTAILFLILIVGVVAAVVAIFLYLQNAKKPTEPAQTSQEEPTPFTFKAKIEYLTGSAYKIIDERKIEILEGDILSQGDTIQTDKDSRLVLSLDDGSVIRIDEDSKIALSTLTSPLSSVTQDSGNVFYRINKDEDHKFEVVAGDVKIQSLGTAYSVENTDVVKVKVFESKVKVLSEETETEVGKDQEWDETSKEVKEIDSQKLADSEFYQWSLTEEKLAKETPAPTAKPTAKPTAVLQKDKTQSGSYIKLSGKAVSDGIKLQWEVSGVDTSKGFKVVKNLTGNPVYPGDHAQYVGSGTSYLLWNITDGKTWRFRVCQYLDGKCGVYSNEITVTASGSSSVSEQGSISSISLSAEKISDSSAKLTWSVEGNAPKGFKVAWSKSTNPTYPPRDGDWWTYLSDPGTRSTEIGGLESGSTYYFRVCEYLGGPCGTYSNQATLAF